MKSRRIVKAAVVALLAGCSNPQRPTVVEEPIPQAELPAVAVVIFDDGSVETRPVTVRREP